MLRPGLQMLRPGLQAVLEQRASDVVIVSALRTPVTRAKKGGFKDTYPEELVAHVLRATLARTRIDAARVDDVVIGTVLSELGGAKAGRMAALHAGLPPSTAYTTVNRQCASGLQAITSAAAQLAAGTLDVAIAGGVESMTRNYGSRAIPVDLSPELKASSVQDALDCIMPMGLTSENVASRYGISREDQDEFAVQSHAKAHAAQSAGRFADEMVSMETRWVANADGGGGVETRRTVAADDGIRPQASLAALAALKPAFRASGSSTAGNSSQISDGAAAALLMRRATADALGLAPIGKFVATAVVGVRPDEMGVGPAVAIPRVLHLTGLAAADVAVWELNEAFASQALHCIRVLGLPADRVNPNGGAIALGHPLGATGARQLATLLPELKRRGERVGVVSMCIGTGSGMASVFVRE